MAKADYHLVIEAVRGELKRADKDEGIEIHSFEFSTEVPKDMTTGMARGRRRYSDVKFRKILDKSSPALQQMLAQHAEIKTATLTCQKAGDSGVMLEYYKVVWSNAYVSSYHISGENRPDEFGPIPRDEFTLNFNKVEFTYTMQASKGGKAGSTSFADELNNEAAPGYRADKR